MIRLTIPGMRLVSEANSHTHWRQRQQRAKEHRTTACWVTMAELRKPRAAHWIRTVRDPVRITITRLAPRSLDSDNLVGSAKHVRDGVADALGINDRDERVQWVVTQEKSASGYAVRIQIEAWDRSQEPEPASRLRGKTVDSG